VEHRHASDIFALPQGPSLRSGLCCPKPSPLNRPHPPRSRAHRDFTARRLIRNAFAVRERLGDPRAVPGFYCTFRPDMPSSKTPGSSTSISSRQRYRHWPSPRSERLGTPKIPAIRFPRGVNFEASTVRTFATACQFARPPVRIRPTSRPSGTFTSRLPTGWLPVAGYDYNSDWTPLLVGLSPTGMAASLAAPDLLT
jgi:hypothetical protein